jgi:hypothetical protein
LRKIRNAVVIIILCLIGAYSAYKPAPLSFSIPPSDFIRDAVAGEPARVSRRPNIPEIHATNVSDESLRDSVAGNAVPEAHHSPRGTTEDQTPPPPRGGDHSGIGPLGNNNPGSQLPPPPLSPSGPSNIQ